MHNFQSNNKKKQVENNAIPELQTMKQTCQFQIQPCPILDRQINDLKNYQNPIDLYMKYALNHKFKKYFLIY